MVAYLKQQHVEGMISHARGAAPLEACGILGGKKNRMMELYLARNAACSPVSYRLDPQEQYRIFMDIEEQGLDVAGIYHSHPNSSAVPSGTDLDQAYYPEATYFIVSLADPAHPQIRAFKIKEREVTEEEITIL